MSENTHGSSWSFVAVCDIQVGSPRSYRYQPAWVENWRTARKQIMEIGPDLLLVGGDLTRDGNFHRYELEDMKRDFDRLPFPCRVVAGNMETGNKCTSRNGPSREGREADTRLNVTSEDLKQYREVFGPLWWTVMHKGVRFSGIANMVCGSGLPEEEELWQWIESRTEQPGTRYHVWIMHYPLFMDRPDEGNHDITDPDQYLDWYFTVDEPARTRLLDALSATGATHVITGHVHNRRHCEFAGIRFDYAPATCFRQYEGRWSDGDTTLGFLKYDVTDEGIWRAFIPLQSVSDAEGYGPGGHPPPECRDKRVPDM